MRADAAAVRLAPPRASHRAWGIALAVMLCVTAVMTTMTPSVGEDASWGVLAAEQRLAGLTNSLVLVTEADPADLSRNVVVPVTYWAPGQQAIVYTLRRMGLSLRSTIVFIVFACWLAGLAGWWRYCSRAAAPRLVPWILALFGLFRLNHGNAFVYLGGETLLWAAFPWVVLANLDAQSPRRANRVLPAALTGALTILLVELKYSAAFLGLGIAAAWAWEWRRGRVSTRTLAAWTTGAAVAGALALAGTLGETLAGKTPLTPTCSYPVFTALAWASAGPFISLADLHEALNSWSLTAGLADAPSLFLPALCLGVDGLVAAWMFTHRGSAAGTSARGGARPAARMAAAVSIVVAGGLAVYLIRGGCLSYEGRHFQYAAFLLLPLVATSLADAAVERQPWGRVLTAACAVLFLVVPAAYGTGALLDKAFRRMPALANGVAPDGPRFDWAADGQGLRGLTADVLSQPWFKDALFVTETPGMALVAPARRLLLLGTSDPIPVHLPGTLPHGMVVLMRSVSADRSQAVRRAADSIQEWDHVPAGGSDLQVWRGR